MSELRSIKQTVSDYTDTRVDVSDKIALIDADKLKYLVTYKIFKTYEMEGEYPDFKDYLEAEINEYKDAFNAKDMIFVFSGKSKNTFRYCIAVEREYKGNRKRKSDYAFYERKEQDLIDILEYMKLNYNTLIYSDLEADDVISMLQNEHTFVVSDDKDLLQIEGMHYDKKSGETVLVDRDMSIHRIALQMLMGDSTDNILGLNGYGKAKSEKVLADLTSYEKFQAVLKEYIAVHGYVTGTDYFTEVWQLIKLRLPRSDYMKLKYAGAFGMRDMLIYK